MRLNLLCWLGFFVFTSVPAAGQSVAELPIGSFREPVDKARSLARESLRAGGLPGLSVAVWVGDRIVWSEGFGWADLEQRVAVTPLTRFRIGSISKPFTAAGLALLVEGQRLDLDAPVREILPSFPEKKYPLTTRQLAGHLAGIRHYRGQEFLSSAFYPTVDSGLAMFADDPLLFEPGTKYSYSSHGWNLISAVMEEVSGRAFLDFMRDEVFAPLGMRHTVADLNSRIIPNRARFYQKDEEGRLMNATYVDNSYKWAGGGFLSTPEDMIRFGVAHLAPGFLSERTLEEWTTPQSLSDGTKTQYGIGWGLAKDDRGRSIVQHSGGSVGGTTMLALYPEDAVVVAMTSNLSSARLPNYRRIAALFLRD